MKIPESYLENLKWAIYEWLGAISVKELVQNRHLAEQVERLCKTLRMATT